MAQVRFSHAGGTAPSPRLLPSRLSLGRGFKEAAFLWHPDTGERIPMRVEEYLNLGRTHAPGLPPRVEAYAGDYPWEFRSLLHRSPRAVKGLLAPSGWTLARAAAVALLLALALAPGVAMGAVAFHAAGGGTNGFGSTVTIGLDPGTGSDRHLSGWGMCTNFGPATPSSATYNGAAMTVTTAEAALSNNCRTRMFNKASLPAGGSSYNLVITFSASAAIAGEYAVHTGVDQTTPTSDPKTGTAASGSSALVSLTFTSATGDMGVLGCHIDQGGVTIAASGASNERRDSGNPPRGLYDEAGASSVAVEATISVASGWAAAGANLKATGGGGGPTAPGNRRALLGVGV